MSAVAAGNVKVSCLMVTLPVPERLNFLRRSLSDYCRQTHRDRELVIVLDDGTPAAKAAIAREVAALGRDDVRIIDAAQKLSLGGLRNLSRECAGGEAQCQWDDDDRHHPQRLERQLATMIAAGCEAVYLQEVLQFFPGERRLYWTNWRATQCKAHPGTLMCLRSASFHYPDRPKNSPDEDKAAALQLLERGSVEQLAGMPELYVYVSHGANAWAMKHHRMLAQELGLSQGLLRRREPELRQALRCLDLGPAEVTVMGYNGPAFSLGGAAAV